MTKINAAVALLLLCLGLAGCGGAGPGGGGDGMDGGDGGMDGSMDGGGIEDPAPNDPDALPNTTDRDVDVRVVQFNNSGDLVVVVAGVFDGTTGETTVDSLQLALDSASPLTVDRGYSAALETGTNFRLIYTPTAFDELPTTGQTVYNGAAEVLITLTDAGDATGTYAGIMDVEIVADFDTPNASSLTFDTISDATFTAASDPTAGAGSYDPTGDEVLMVSGVQDTQTGLANGSETAAELGGFGDTGATATATASEIELEAGFAGASAFEIAGGLQISADDAEIRIGFTAEQ